MTICKFCGKEKAVPHFGGKCERCLEKDFVKLDKEQIAAGNGRCYNITKYTTKKRLESLRAHAKNNGLKIYGDN